MTLKPLIVTSLVLALTSGIVRAQTPEAPSSDGRFDLALADYERGHWQQAWSEFSSLADLGLPDAARIAVLMWRHGERLYRVPFAASIEQVQRWASLAACTVASGEGCRTGP